MATWESVKTSAVVEDTAEKNNHLSTKGQAEYMQDDKYPSSTQTQSGPSSTMSLAGKEETWQRRKLVFWVRPCSGWTRSLRDTCLEQPHLPLKTKLLIESPYGHTIPLHTYDNVLNVIGGTGIPVATSYLTDYMRRSALNPARTRTKNINLLWAVRQEQHIVDMFEGPVGLAFKCDGVSTALYATRQAEISQKAKDPGITPCRLKLRDEIFRYVEEVCPTQRTAALVCGPAGMADAARDAVKAVVNNGRREMEYFEEAYGW